MILVHAPRALRDIDAILNYIQPRNPRAAHDISQAIESAAELSAQWPLTGGKTDVPNLYRRPLVRYPYTIFYSVDEAQDRVEIMRVIYAGRVKSLRRLPDEE